MTPGVLPETKTILLDAGQKILLVGANDAGVAKFRIAGEDRYDFMNVGAIKQAVSLHGKNISFIIVNGRIPTEVIDKVQTLGDRAHAQAVYITVDGGALLRMMEEFPKHNKGVITFQVPQVTQVIDLQTPPANPSAPPPALPTKLPEQAQPPKPPKSRGEVPPELFPASASQELLEAAKLLQSSQQRVIELAEKVAAENERLKSVIGQQAEQLKVLPALEVEVAGLRQKAEAARKLLSGS